MSMAEAAIISMRYALLLLCVQPFVRQGGRPIECRFFSTHGRFNSGQLEHRTMNQRIIEPKNCSIQILVWVILSLIVIDVIFFD